MTTILHVAQPTVGGVPQMVLGLTAGQLAGGDQVFVACPGDGVLAERARSAGAQVRVWESDRSPTRGLARETAALRRIVAEVRPDVLHLHSSKAGLVGRLVVRGRIPTVFQPQAWSFHAARGAVRAASVRWETYGARWAHRIVCATESDRDEGLAAGVRGAGARYAIVPNGIDVERFADVPPAAWHPARPAVVCVARLCRQKGQDVLLAAWPRVRSAVPGARLILVGDGPDRQALYRQALGLGLRVGSDVEFAGDAPDARPWYRMADVLAMPSRWEGMALVPLEAMAACRPVVLTDVAGARESLPPPQAPVPVGDPEALARALVGLLLDDGRRAAAARAGRAHVATRFGISEVVARIRGVYRDAADELP